MAAPCATGMPGSISAGRIGSCASRVSATVRDLRWRWALSESNFIELVATVFLITVAVVAFRRLPLAYSAYLAAGMILPLWSPSAVHPLMSMHRFALTLFPAFIVLALLGRRRWAHARDRRYLRTPPRLLDDPVRLLAVGGLSAGRYSVRHEIRATKKPGPSTDLGLAMPHAIPYAAPKPALTKAAAASPVLIRDRYRTVSANRSYWGPRLGYEPRSSG